MKVVTREKRLYKDGRKVHHDTNTINPSSPSPTPRRTSATNAHCKMVPSDNDVEMENMSRDEGGSDK